MHQPAERSFHRPPAWKHREAAGARFAAHDFEVDAEAGGVVDEVLAIAAVRPALADGGVGRGDPVEQGLAGRGARSLSLTNHLRGQIKEPR